MRNEKEYNKILKKLIDTGICMIRAHDALITNIDDSSLKNVKKATDNFSDTISAIDSSNLSKNQRYILMQLAMGISCQLNSYPNNLSTNNKTDDGIDSAIKLLDKN